MIISQFTRHFDLISDAWWIWLYAAWLIGGTLFLLLRRRRPVTMLAWMLGFWSLPLLSGLAYYFFGPRHVDKKMVRRQQAKQYSVVKQPDSSEPLPETFTRATPFHALADVTRNSGEAGLKPSQASSLTLYRDGADALPAMERALASATRTLHLEYYIWKPDVTGTIWRTLLCERAKAGIEVRLLVDALGAKDCSDAFWQPLIDVGGEVRAFNAPHWLKPQPGMMNFRTHRKIIVVDGKTGFTGGINVIDNNRPNVHSESIWRNTHLRIDGKPARDLQHVFLEDWLYGVPVGGSTGGEIDAPDSVDHWFPSLPANSSDDPWVQIIDSGPDEPGHDIHRLIFAAIAAARTRVWISTPYFVPDDAIQTALTTAAARGVDVRIMIPEVSDMHLVDAAARGYAEEVVAEGASVLLYQSRMTHSKTLLVDDGLSIVGTANMDNRSFRLNFEIVAALFDQATNATLATHFEEDSRHCIVFTDEQFDRGRWRRIKSNAARLLAPLL